MYTSVLKQLASISYSGALNLYRYNEPLADKIFLERLAEARKLLPDALLHINTNGDYLDPEYIKQLYDTGLRGLDISVYLSNKAHYDHEKIKKASNKILKRLGLPHILTRDLPGMRYERRLYYRDMSIRLHGRNISATGQSRGKLLPIQKPYCRTSPCLLPVWAVYIDHDGTMMPCCNLRSDAEAHSTCIMGSLAENPDIFMHYAGQKLASFRANIIGIGLKQGVCSDCAFVEEQPTQEQIEFMKRINPNQPSMATGHIS